MMAAGALLGWETRLRGQPDLHYWESPGAITLHPADMAVCEERPVLWTPCLLWAWARRVAFQPP